MSRWLVRAYLTGPMQYCWKLTTMSCQKVVIGDVLGEWGSLRARSVIFANLGLWAKSISTSHALSCSYSLAWKLQKMISLCAKDGKLPHHGGYLRKFPQVPDTHFTPTRSPTLIVEVSLPGPSFTTLSTPSWLPIQDSESTLFLEVGSEVASLDSMTKRKDRLRNVRTDLARLSGVGE